MKIFILINTKYIGPTDRLGSRVKATCGTQSVTLPWLSELDPNENFQRAAKILVKRIFENEKKIVSRPNHLKIVGFSSTDEGTVFVCRRIIKK